MPLPAHREDPSTAYVAGSLVVGALFAGVAGGVAYPTLPRLGDLVGLSSVVVGLVLSANGIARLVVNAPAGDLLDRVGTRRPILAGFLVLAVAPLGYALGLDTGAVPLSPAAVFLASRAAWGVGTALVLVGSFATMVHVTTRANRGRWLGYMSGANGLGLPVGLVAGGVVADVVGVRESFLLAGGLGVVATLLVAAVLPDCSPATDERVGLRALPGLVRADRRVPLVGAVHAAIRFLAGVLLATVVLYAGERGLAVGGFSESGVGGVVLAVSVCCAAVSNLVVGHLSDVLENRVAVVVPALLLVGAGFLLVAGVPTLAGVGLGVAVTGVGGGAVVPPLLAYLGDISPAEDVGKFGGVFNLFGDLGAVLGPLVAVPLGSTVGFAAVYLACAGLVVLVTALVATALLSTHATPIPAPAE